MYKCKDSYTCTYKRQTQEHKRTRARTHAHTEQGHALITPQHQHLSRSKAVGHPHTLEGSNGQSQTQTPLKVRRVQSQDGDTITPSAK